MRIAILGGTGREGRGLAVRWARAGHQVIIGSREAERAAKAAEELSALAGKPLTGAEYTRAIEQAEVVLVSVPYAAHGELLTSLKTAFGSRVVIDITVPLKPPKVQVVNLPPGQAAALEAQAILGGDCRLVSTLHHVSAVHLIDPAHVIDCDVLVCSDHDDARALAIGLVGDLGLRGLDAGPLRNAVALESLTAVLLHLNKRYKAPGAGIRFTGLPQG
jgi:8-hydroxy-5-deazaflavin:NADPH oxidoreductase